MVERELTKYEVQARTCPGCGRFVDGVGIADAVVVTCECGDYSLWADGKNSFSWRQIRVPKSRPDPLSGLIEQRVRFDGGQA